MPLDPRSPAYQAALDSFVSDVEKTMRDKLASVGDFKNLADLESEIDRLTLRIELLGTDPEFQEVSKRVEARRNDLARKRDQIKPFLMKLERELAVYRAAQQAGSLGISMSPAQAPAPAPAPAVAAPRAPATPAVSAPPPRAPSPPPAAAPPSRPAPAWAPAPAPQPAATPVAVDSRGSLARGAAAVDPSRSSMPPPVGDDEWASAASAAPDALDMSLPPEEPMPESFVAAPTDFITGPGVQDASFADGAELMLENEVPSAPPSAGAQWPPPGEAIPDPFAAFQPARPAAPAQPPRPAAPQAPARPAPGNPAGRPVAAPAAGKPGAKPPWQK